MHRRDNSLVMSQPREVYAMQPQKPNVTRMAFKKPCSKKCCHNTMESTNGCINNFKARMLENGRVDGDDGANVGGICVLCEQNFYHIWRSCSECICQACQQSMRSSTRNGVVQSQAHFRPGKVRPGSTKSSTSISE